ncbi:MAG: sigma-70 family RNA polymerase sigma factor [Planctomycetota bacterium]
MFGFNVDRDFARYRASGDPAALARVFDGTASQLLSLARHLASTEAAAEDLLQSTFVTVIESRHQHDGERAVLPWLTGILANHARAARRRAKRAVDRDRLVAEPSPDPVELAAGAELDTTVAQAIEALANPYRSVVRLHLVHGLTPAEIHEVLDRPAATVRSQLARGLDLLRRRLPIGVGAATALSLVGARGLAQVRSAVVGKAGGAPTAATTLGLASLVTLMIGKLAWAAIAAVAITGWFLLNSRSPEAPMRSDAEVVPNALSPASATASPSLSDDAVDRAAVQKGSPAVGRSEVADPDAAPVLRVRVRRFRDGAPLVGTSVSLRGLDSLTDLSVSGPKATTDENGVATFLDPPDGAVMVGIPQSEHVRVIPSPRAEVEIVDVVLPLGCSVRGQVVDDAGRPVEGAAILGYGNYFEGSRLTESDADGRFAIDDLSPGMALAANHPGRRPSLAVPVPEPRETPVELRLVLGGPTRLVRGVIRDGDGRPSAAATVLAVAAGGPTLDPRVPHERAVSTRAGADGGYSIEIDTTRAWWLVASPVSREHFTVTRVDVPPGDAAIMVDVVLLRSASIEGRVRVSGEVPSRSTITAFLESPEQDIGYLGNGLGLVRSAIAADGSYRLAGLAPGTHRVSVSAGAHTIHGSRVIREGVREFWDVDLVGGFGLTLHVRGGHPTGAGLLPMWSIRLYRVSDAGEREFVSMARADKDGRAEFESLAPGRYAVTIGVIGLGPLRDQVLESLTAEVPLAKDLFCDATRLAMPTGSIRGRLLDVEGVPVVGRGLLAIRTDGSGTWGGTSESDGSFRFEPLAPGSWRIVLQGGEYESVGDATELAVGEARDLGDLRLR